MAAVAEGVEAQSSGEATDVEHPPPGVEPDAVGHGRPQHADDDDGRREHAAGGHVGEHAEAPEPRGGQDDEGDEHDEELLPGDHEEGGATVAEAESEAEAGAREQLVQVVPFQDEEADGDEVELGVEERGRGEAAAAPERERADVRVAPHGRGRVHAPLQEQARVAAHRRDDEQERQAQPPALRQRVRDGQQPDA